MATNPPGDGTTRIPVEIRDELRGVRDGLHEVRDELGAHGEQLRAHTELLGATMTEGLRAVEHGNAARDDRTLDHETRITRIEERIGLRS